MNVDRVRHIFWDWNGTLLDDAWLCCGIMNTMLARRGMPAMSMERYQEIFDFPVETYYRRIGFDFSRESFETLGTEFIEIYEQRRHEPRLHPDTLPALQRVRRAGLGQSILSAYRQETLNELIHHHRLQEFFDELHGHHDHYANGKIPTARRALAAASIDPGQAVLVGDTAHDHEVAQALGMQCILIPAGNHSEERLRQHGDCVLPDRLAVLQLLRVP